jgi:hypothetical protein
MAKNSSNSPSFALNAVIGFLGLLLGVLIFALVTRVVYPRIQNTRAESQTKLIGNVIQIEVLNGCGVPGLANDFTAKLRRHGFDVVETGNFNTFDIDQTLVISRTGDLENAKRVARTLGISEKNVLREESPDFYLDATIVIGSDYKSLNLN